MTTPSTSRRAFLATSLAGAATLLTACNGRGTSSPITSDRVLLKLTPSDGRLAAGVPDRLPLTFGDESGQPTPTAGPEYLHVEVTKLSPTGEPEATPFAGVDVRRQGRELPYTYYPLHLTFPTAGYFRLAANVSSQIHSTTVGVVDPSRAEGAIPGSRLDQLVDPAQVISPPCSQWPQCSLHQVPLDRLATSQKPFAIVLLSPAVCHTAPCQQLLDLAAEATTATGVPALHAEVIEPGSMSSATPTPTTLANSLVPGMELSVLTINSGGVVANRLDAIFDRGELEESLSALS